VARWLADGHTPAEVYARLCREGPAMLTRQGISKEETDHFAPLLAGELAAWPEERVRSSGYVLHTLEAALWCLLRHDSFAATVLAAVNLDEDTDTTAAVAGGLAGLYYGEASFPAEWLAVLARREDIKDLATRLSSAVASSGIAPRS
jgi:ADP-ribosylglycohydrolase